MKTKKSVQWEKVNRLPDTEWKGLLAGASWESAGIVLLLLASVFTLFQLPGEMYISRGHVLALIVSVACVVFLREVLLLRLLDAVQKKKLAMLLRIVVMAAVALLVAGILWRYGKVHFDELEDGFLAFAKNYCEDYNLTFQKNVVISGGDEDEVSIFFCFAAFCVFTVLFGLSPMGRRKYLFLMPPISMIAFIMYVGKAPKWSVICLVLAGALMIHRSWRKKGYYKSNAIVIAAAVGLLLLVGVIYQPAARQVLSRSREVKAFEAKLETNVKHFFTNFSVPRGRGADTSVSNNVPKYRDEKILTIRLDHAPEGNLYLQEYYGERYDHGLWTTTLEDFSTFCAQEGINEAMATNSLSSSVYRCFSQEDYEQVLRDKGRPLSDAKQHFVSQFEIQYKNKNAGSMLLPYGTNVAGNPEVVFTGSTVPQKRAGTRKVTFEGWNSSELDPQSLTYGKTRVINDRSEEEKDFWNAYNVYVRQQYLDYPSFLKNTANYDYYFSTMGGIQYDPKTSVVILDDQQYSVEYKLTDMIARELERSGISVEEISFEIATSAASNQKRVSYAEQLQWIMTNGNSVYSWNLDPLGEDEDPIEYFLNHPRKGYCTHYASAATLLLRSVGVPARYVTGYIVTAASFEKQKDGSYEAQVIDRNGHAWVEIYLDDIGWVPFEMTPGYESTGEAIPTSKEMEEARREEESTRQSQEESAEATPDPEVAATPDPTEEPAITPTEPPAAEKPKDKKVGESDTEEGGDQNGSLRKPSAGLVIAGIVIALALIGLATFLVRERASAGRLEKALKGRYFKAAVVLMNGRIYRKLRRKRMIKTPCRTDAEYETALRSAFSAENEALIGQYMRIVKAAAFSGGSISKEDCQLVRKVYQMVK
ncbi:MAG: hypothetical protein J6U66_08345 [Lachnospiraceae bacterium]|nr:hypothetical protein [Lachnospiraceae bacterium]